MAERFNAPVLKTGGRKPTWVRIPPPPFQADGAALGRAGWPLRMMQGHEQFEVETETGRRVVVG